MKNRPNRPQSQWLMDDPKLEHLADVWRGSGDPSNVLTMLDGAPTPLTRSRARTYTAQLAFLGPAPGSTYLFGPPPEDELWIFRGLTFWNNHAVNSMLSFDATMLTLGTVMGFGFPGTPTDVDVPLLETGNSPIALSPFLGSFLATTPFTIGPSASYSFRASGGGLVMIHRARIAATGRRHDVIRLRGHGDGVNPGLLHVSMMLEKYRYLPPNPAPQDV